MFSSKAALSSTSLLMILDEFVAGLFTIKVKTRAFTSLRYPDCGSSCFLFKKLSQQIRRFVRGFWKTSGSAQISVFSSSTSSSPPLPHQIKPPALRRIHCDSMPKEKMEIWTGLVVVHCSSLVIGLAEGGQAEPYHQIASAVRNCSQGCC